MLMLWFGMALAFDADSDGVDDAVDNCGNVSNPGQLDSDSDQFGDACDPCPTADGSQ